MKVFSLESFPLYGTIRGQSSIYDNACDSSLDKSQFGGTAQLTGV